MCYTFAAAMTEKELEERFQADRDNFEHHPNYHLYGFVKPSISIVQAKNGKNFLSSAYWGLIPNWVKSKEQADEIRVRTLNARGETLLEKPSFKHLVERNRCVVPVSGFFEWKHEGKLRIPHYIFRKDHVIMALAGLHDLWINPKDGTIVKTCSIITTTANPLMAEIHNTKKRMPVILNSASEKAWLNASTKEAEAMQLLIPFSDQEMMAHPISNFINKRGINRNNKALIAEAPLPPIQGTLF